MEAKKTVKERKPLPVGDWTYIRPNRILNIPEIRNDFPPTERVYYLKETISSVDCLGETIYFIVIIKDTNPDYPIQVPVNALELSENQREELILHNLVPREIFEED